MAGNDLYKQYMYSRFFSRDSREGFLTLRRVCDSSQLAAFVFTPFFHGFALFFTPPSHLAHNTVPPRRPTPRVRCSLLPVLGPHSGTVVDEALDLRAEAVVERCRRDVGYPRLAQPRIPPRAIVRPKVDDGSRLRYLHI